MSRNNYGIPYQGSKNFIAKDIVDVLPDGKRLVDLFGGGGAITHAALESGKYERVLYNDINPLPTTLFLDAVNGKYNLKTFKRPFVSREEFFEKKDTDAFVKYIYSFANNGEGYIFGEEYQNGRERAQKQGYDYVMFGTPIPWLNFQSETVDIIERRKELNKYVKQKQKEIYEQEPRLKKVFKKYKAIITNKALPPKYSVIFTRWLKSTGVTVKEINELTNSQMAYHYLCVKEDGQPAIPTAEMFDKLKQHPKLQAVEIPHEIKELVYDEEKIKQLKETARLEELVNLERLEELVNLERLELLENLKRLERLVNLEGLERLVNLEGLERLENLEITNNDYKDYTYRPGDVVYCDIPYENTADAYGVIFDHKAFYDWAREQTYPVFFSSYELDYDWARLVWQKKKTSKMVPGSKQATEYLYRIN